MVSISMKRERVMNKKPTRIRVDDCETLQKMQELKTFFKVKKDTKFFQILIRQMHAQSFPFGTGN